MYAWFNKSLWKNKNQRYCTYLCNKKDFLGRANTYFYKNRDCDQEPLFSMNNNLEKALETDEEAIMKMLEFLVEMTEKLEND